MSVENIVKGVLEKVEYSEDYGTAGAGATWVEIPNERVMSNNATIPSEVPNVATLLDGREATASFSNAFAIPVALKDGDTFLDALKTAADNLTQVWFRIKPLGRNARIVGGQLGCIVRVQESVMPEFEQLESAIIFGSTSGADSEDTFHVEGSGS